MKSKFANYFDFIFKILIIFIIALIWFRSYYHNNTDILIYSFLTTAGFGTMFAIFAHKKDKKVNATKYEKSQINLMINKLTFNTNKENLQLLNDCLKNNYQTKIYSNYLQLKTDNCIGIVVDFDNTNITEYQVLKIYKQFKNKSIKKIFVCCNNIDKNAFDLTNKIKDVEIILLNKESTYFSIFKKFNYVFKSEEKLKQNKKAKFKEYLFLAFNRKKTKNYLFAGIVLLIGSFFMRYNTYYLIWTSIMLLFALFSFFNKPFNPKINSNIF